MLECKDCEFYHVPADKQPCKNCIEVDEQVNDQPKQKSIDVECYLWDKDNKDYFRCTAKLVVPLGALTLVTTSYKSWVLEVQPEGEEITLTIISYHDNDKSRNITYNVIKREEPDLVVVNFTLGLHSKIYLYPETKIAYST